MICEEDKKFINDLLTGTLDEVREMLGMYAGYQEAMYAQQSEKLDDINDALTFIGSKLVVLEPV